MSHINAKHLQMPMKLSATSKPTKTAPTWPSLGTLLMATTALAISITSASTTGSDQILAKISTLQYITLTAVWLRLDLPLSTPSVWPPFLPDSMWCGCMCTGLVSTLLLLTLPKFVLKEVRKWTDSGIDDIGNNSHTVYIYYSLPLPTLINLYTVCNSAQVYISPLKLTYNSGHLKLVTNSLWVTLQACNHLAQSYSMIYSQSGKIHMYTHFPCRHSLPMSMLQFRMRCIGASESTVLAFIHFSNTLTYTMATSAVQLEDTSPSELIYTQLVLQLTQQISRVPWLLGCMGMIQTKQLPYSEVSTL